MKHIMPPMVRNRWLNMAQDFRDLEFANVPMISIDIPTATTILQKLIVRNCKRKKQIKKDA